MLSDEAFGVEKHHVWEEESRGNGGHFVRGKLCGIGRVLSSLRSQNGHRQGKRAFSEVSEDTVLARTLSSTCEETTSA